ncbi:MAG: glucans biosynthesis glucosyltransferase MdoH [Acetobacteraceae bacterium]|nr:glucans biosynthesis glucosyltransferase MdoH [Acetobacteraceae bacterium]
MLLRRLAFVLLWLGIAGALLALAARVLPWPLILPLLLVLPWVALSAANGVLGLALLLSRDPLPRVLPALRHAKPGLPRGLTGIAVCLRNEEMARVLPPLARLLDGLAAAGAVQRFELWFLSDTSDPALIAAEDAAIAAFRAARPQDAARIHLRRRAVNTGFKAGNIMAFLDAEGRRLDHLLTLDADSEMSAHAVLRLVAAMEARSNIALIQQLIVGRPASSPFPRLFQFGMRAGMRAWAMGQAWWQGPEGPYWGHNALIRVAPFRTHCRLETLPDGSTVLSHDMVEATRLTAAAWQVWCLPDEAGSLEANPPALPEFITRDLRWGAGNMQYLELLKRPHVTLLGRWQLAQAILLFLCAPAWALAFALAVPLACAGAFEGVPGWSLAGVMLAFWAAAHAPKLAGYAEVMLRGDRAARYGGRARFAAGALAELVFATLLAPIRVAHMTRFLLALPFGARIGWAAQNRADRDVGWEDAVNLLAPHALIGLALFLPLASWAPWALPFAFVWAGGLLLAIPFCVVTASSRFGAWLRARGLAATPEEIAG